MSNETNNLNSISKRQLEAIRAQFADELKKIKAQHKLELQKREDRFKRILDENGIHEFDLVGHEAENADYNKEKQDLTSKWPELLSPTIALLMMRNPKMLTDCFGVSKKVINEVFKEKGKPTQRKCPIQG